MRRLKESNNSETFGAKRPKRKPRGTDSVILTVDPSEVSRRGLSRSSLRLEFFAGPWKGRVPYSLRHTYATMRISEGISVFQLAANMGTSVEMIESFYGKKRMRDPKMAKKVTKFRGR